MAQALYDNIVMGEGAARLASWRNFWLVPCLTAAVILVLFLGLFRGKRAA